MRTAYYNEFDPYAAAWLRNLIAEGLIADGEVDDRSIVDVRADDLRGFTQCHFFAGIGGWSYALRLAGWPDDRPVWTGSCPCQPFSVAGQGKGVEDHRDLWPVWSALIRECRPPVVFGEQVAAAIGMHWLDRSRVDLEGAGYAFGSAVLPACAVGAPHRRDRLWFVADADSATGQQDARGAPRDEEADGRARRHPLEPHRDYGLAGNGEGGPLADASGERRDGREDAAGRNDARGQAAGWGEGADRSELRGEVAVADAFGQRGRGGHDPWEDAADGDAPGQGNGAGVGAGAGGVADAETERLSTGTLESGRRSTAEQPERQSTWGGAVWLTGADGKARRVEPGIRLLAHGVPARVGRLRAYGNAIVPQVAAEFIGAWLDCRP